MISGVLVDLTLPISEKLPNFPGSPAPLFLNWSDLKQDGYNLELFFMSTHSGTHIDAPYHFARDGKTIDQIPIGRLITNATLVKVRKKPEQKITKSDIISFEREHGMISGGDSVIFYTGWQKNLRQKNYFTCNPGLSGDAALYLASKKINLVGIDSPSIDPGRDKKFTSHNILSQNDILIVENLSNLEKINETEFSLIVLPLKLRGASGSPVRAVGITT